MEGDSRDSDQGGSQLVITISVSWEALDQEKRKQILDFRGQREALKLPERWRPDLVLVLFCCVTLSQARSSLGDASSVCSRRWVIGLEGCQFLLCPYQTHGWKPPTKASGPQRGQGETQLPPGKPS